MEKTTDYTGNFVYQNSSLKMIITDDGRLLPDSTGFAYEYFIKDHLGNTRVSVQDSLGYAVVEQEDHYYPFGMRMQGMSFTAQSLIDNETENKYLYNGKELQDELGLNWLDYGKRFYDAQIGRSHVVDNYAEKYNFMSPYQYAGNNPMNNIDINGDSIWSTQKGNVVTYHISGKIINFSSSNIDMEKARKNIKSYFESIYQSKDVDGLDYEFSFEMEVAESMEEVSESNHLLVFAEDLSYTDIDKRTDVKTKYSADGFADRWSKVAFVDPSKYIAAIEGVTRMLGYSASHELGHNFGLKHSGNPFNLMKEGTPNSYQEWVTVITNSQIRFINKNYSRLNNGTNTGMDGLPYYPINEGWRAKMVNTYGRKKRINYNKLK